LIISLFLTQKFVQVLLELTMNLYFVPRKQVDPNDQCPHNDLEPHRGHYARTAQDGIPAAPVSAVGTDH